MLQFHASSRCLTSGVCLHDNMLGISCSRCFNSLLFNKWSMPTRQHAWYFMFTMLNSLLFDKWSMPTRQHAWYFMFTMLQFASVWQVEYAYTTTCLVFHVHDASIRFCLTSGVCLHDNMLGISCSRCFNSLLFDKWSMPTRQHAWYFMFTMLQFACLTSGVCLHTAWYFMFTMLLRFCLTSGHTTTWLVFHVHDASIRFCLTSGVCLHDIMLGISCSQCFNSLLFNKWSMPTRQHAGLTSGVCLHDNMLGISCSQCFNSLLFNKWSMPIQQHAWYFMFTMLTSIRFCLTSGVCLHDNMLGISCSRCFNSLLFNK